MSEQYRALTRKYRPKGFEEIVSQGHVSSTLLNAIKQNRISHAYMFCGPRGVGKTTMARVLARTINGIDESVDGELLNQTLNIVEMDAASNNGVEDVHHLRESVRIPPQNGRYKVFIIDEVHMLSKQAFNALLKTLEEPPAHAIFIFATTEPHKVLPTILSRVQRFDFKRISVNEIVERLRKISLDENITIDEESLHIIAKKADGALRDALGLMDQAIAFCGDVITENELLKALNVVGSERLFEFMNCVKEKNADSGLQLINVLLQEGYDIQEFLIGLAEHLRNIYVAHHSEQLYLVEASEETKKRYLECVKDFSRDDLLRMLHLVSEAQIKIKDANQPRIHFEITLLKLIHMQRSEHLAELLSELEDLKKNFSSLGSAEQSSPLKPTNGVHHPETKKQEPAEVGDEEQNEEVDVQKSRSENTDLVNVQVQEPVVNNTSDQLDGKENGAEIQNENLVFDAEEDEEDDDEYGLGRPALVTELSKAVKTEQKDKVEVSAEQSFSEAATNGAIEEPQKVVKIEDVKAVWDDYLKSLKSEIPMILQLQIERSLPVRLKGTELFLECDNPLGKKMLEEQALELCKKLKEFIGVSLRFSVEISTVSNRQEKRLNPYEQFKELQEKDPILKELVNRFGAELEY